MQVNKLILVAGPSGVGKSTLIQKILNDLHEIAFSVSITSRKPRLGEQDGKDYFFINTSEFQERVAAQHFIEYEMVFPEVYYGTLKSELDKIWEEGKIPLLDLDVKGVQHILNLHQFNTLSIFIAPPSIEELRSRLQHRGSESEEKINERIKRAQSELEMKNKFDYFIVNDDVEFTFQKIKQRIQAFLAETSSSNVHRSNGH